MRFATDHTTSLAITSLEGCDCHDSTQAIPQVNDLVIVCAYLLTLRRPPILSLELSSLPVCTQLLPPPQCV